MTKTPNTLPSAPAPDPADAVEHLVVTDAQVRAAMAHFEQLRGRGDGVALCREVSDLADLLGTMWHAHETQARVPRGSRVGQLLLDSGVVEADLEGGEEAAAPRPR